MYSLVATLKYQIGDLKPSLTAGSAWSEWPHRNIWPRWKEGEWIKCTEI